MTRASRRRFLKLVLTGSAAVVASGVAPRVRPSRAASPVASTAMRREIASQKAYVTRSLKAIRDYHLPPGTDMGFVFHPLARARRPKSR